MNENDLTEMIIKAYKEDLHRKIRAIDRDILRHLPLMPMSAGQKLFEFQICLRFIGMFLDDPEGFKDEIPTVEIMRNDNDDNQN